MQHVHRENGCLVVIPVRVHSFRPRRIGGSKLMCAACASLLRAPTKPESCWSMGIPIGGTAK